MLELGNEVNYIDLVICPFCNNHVYNEMGSTIECPSCHTEGDAESFRHYWAVVNDC